MNVRLNYSGSLTSNVGSSWNGSFVGITSISGGGSTDYEAAGFQNTATATTGIFTISGVFTTSTAGTFKVEVAQGTLGANAGQPWHSAGSYIIATPLN